MLALKKTGEMAVLISFGDLLLQKIYLFFFNGDNISLEVVSICKPLKILNKNVHPV